MYRQCNLPLINSNLPCLENTVHVSTLTCPAVLPPRGLILDWIHSINHHDLKASQRRFLTQVRHHLVSDALVWTMDLAKIGTLLKVRPNACLWNQVRRVFILRPIPLSYFIIWDEEHRQFTHAFHIIHHLWTACGCVEGFIFRGRLVLWRDIVYSRFTIWDPSGSEEDATRPAA